MGEMSSEITKKTPEQWVEHYQGAYLHNLTAESVSRIIKSDMTNVARQCVSIGFHLKAARDRELYKDAGYSTLWEYAADQFGLSMSSASRYITINDRFSVGGNTPMLMEEYRNFSKSQLQEMISLSPEQAKKVTEKTTVKQIREMKPKKEKLKEVPAMVIDQEDTSDQCQVRCRWVIIPVWYRKNLLRRRNTGNVCIGRKRLAPYHLKNRKQKVMGLTADIRVAGIVSTMGHATWNAAVRKAGQKAKMRNRRQKVPFWKMQ